jgi:hypothetical protein
MTYGHSLGKWSDILDLAAVLTSAHDLSVGEVHTVTQSRRFRAAPSIYVLRPYGAGMAGNGRKQQYGTSQ